MATGIKKTKKQRTPKTSKGVHGGGGKVTLSPVQRVLIRNAFPKAFRIQQHKEPARQAFPEALRPKS